MRSAVTTGQAIESGRLRSGQLASICAFSLILLAIFLVPALEARDKNAVQFGAGLVVNIPLPVDEVTQAVEDVAGFLAEKSQSKGLDLCCVFRPGVPARRQASSPASHFRGISSRAGADDAGSARHPSRVMTPARRSHSASVSCLMRQGRRDA